VEGSGERLYGIGISTQVLGVHTWLTD